jgi:hypothetical protein
VISSRIPRMRSSSQKLDRRRCGKGLADWKSRLHEAVILLLKKRASMGDGKSPAAAPPTALISTRARLWLPRSGRAFGGMLKVAVAGGFAGLLGSARLFNAGGVRVEAAGGGRREEGRHARQSCHNFRNATGLWRQLA